MDERSQLSRYVCLDGLEVSALVWAPDRSVLLAAARSGEVCRVDLPSKRRTVLFSQVPVDAMAFHDDGDTVLMTHCDGTWWVGGLAAGSKSTVRAHPYRADLRSFFVNDYVVMVGDEASGVRSLSMYKGAERTTYLRLPPGVSAMPSAAGGWMLFRSTQEGLERLSLKALKKGHRFAKGRTPTSHRLKGGDQHILGLTSSSVLVWMERGGPAITLPQRDVVCADILATGEHVLAGTEGGVIVWASMDGQPARREWTRIRMSHNPIRCVSIARRGPWLAAGGDALQIWRCGDGTSGGT